MVLLAEHNVTATPGRRVLEVYDADAYLVDDAALDAAHAQVVAGNGYHLYLLSLQPDMGVQVTIRIWDTAPPPPADAEGHVPVSIESETGTLVIGQLDRGPADDDVTLPRPGVYEGHAWWINRQAAYDYYWATLDQLTDDSPEDYLTEAWNNCPVTERYVLDLAYIREPEPVDDDEDD
ncbi:hypothetical protein [Streptomyces capitiformicae]|uniref:Uncharacterized protein n=1 Tax=Streptomyces capitiformicae TaxID=2014920 RepID=A0A919GMJ7_9ACTN|nr:hypothetical protein [Streptomyces capitiformicae]GHH87231.1 hypothetical protein GCM10017771_27480 [Streptomyces capitiformicae]